MKSLVFKKLGLNTVVVLSAAFIMFGCSSSGKPSTLSY